VGLYPYARTLEIIGERWTFLVLREAFMGVRRFDELQRNTGWLATSSRPGSASW
jgi:DNA-binding HxlR family transcriptional regulator